MRKITPRGVIIRNQLSINAVATASSTEPFARTEADKEQFMRTLKIGLVIIFCLAALTPAISTRVKMAQTSNVYALVKADGKYYVASKEIKVTLGGCGG